MAWSLGWLEHNCIVLCDVLGSIHSCTNTQGAMSERKEQARNSTHIWSIITVPQAYIMGATVTMRSFLSLRSLCASHRSFTALVLIDIHKHLHWSFSTHNCSESHPLPCSRPELLSQCVLSRLSQLKPWYSWITCGAACSLFWMNHV